MADENNDNTNQPGFSPDLEIALRLLIIVDAVQLCIVENFAIDENLGHIHNQLGANDEGHNIVDDLVLNLLENFGGVERRFLAARIIAQIIASIGSSPL